MRHTSTSLCGALLLALGSLAACGRSEQCQRTPQPQTYAECLALLYRGQALSAYASEFGSSKRGIADIVLAFHGALGEEAPRWLARFAAEQPELKLRHRIAILDSSLAVAEQGRAQLREAAAADGAAWTERLVAARLLVELDGGDADGLVVFRKALDAVGAPRDRALEQLTFLGQTPGVLLDPLLGLLESDDLMEWRENIVWVIQRSAALMNGAQRERLRRAGVSLELPEGSMGPR